MMRFMKGEKILISDKEMLMKEHMLRLPVFSIERHRMLTDGVGVTTLVGVIGCPLRCRYCINPHAWNGVMLDSCRYYTAQELYNKLKIDNLYFLATGGGVVFGGGEALMHADFYTQFRNVCGAQWRLTVETSLNIECEKIKKIIDVIDDYIIDIKDINNDIYHAYTGRENKKVIDNLNYLLSRIDSQNICVRVPEIEGYNTKEDIERTVTSLKNMGVEQIEVFSYITKRVKTFSHMQAIVPQIYVD